MRQFIRHPVDIPIEVCAVNQPLHATPNTCNVSLGGIALRSDVPLEPGLVVEIRISIVRPEFQSRARIAWCSTREDVFDVGVQFLDREDAFRARMVEQICHIQDYRKMVHQTEGRQLTAQEAAMEWIGKHASTFPEFGTEDRH